jgi:hypothetical protein
MLSKQSGASDCACCTSRIAYAARSACATHTKNNAVIY